MTPADTQAEGWCGMSTAIVPIERDEITLGEPHGVQLTKTSLTFNRAVSIEEWTNLGEKLNQVEGAIQWWVGDWVNYGEKVYGEKYTQALQLLNYEEKSLRNMASVAKKLEMSRRRDNLSWSHHAEVAALPPEQQTKLLAWAEKENVSVKDLRAEIKQQDQIAPPSNSEVQSLREWIRTECPTLAVRIQAHETYGALSQNIDGEFLDFTVEEMKSLCKFADALCSKRTP